MAEKKKVKPVDLRELYRSMDEASMDRLTGTIEKAVKPDEPKAAEQAGKATEFGGIPSMPVEIDDADII